MEKKHETFVYEGLGFPVEPLDCPMKKVLGEWVLDINMAALQVKVAPMQEIYIRLFLCESFKNSEFIRLFKEIRPETLAKTKQAKQTPFSVNVKELEAANF